MDLKLGKIGDDEESFIRMQPAGGDEFLKEVKDGVRFVKTDGVHFIGKRNSGANKDGNCESAVGMDCARRSGVSHGHFYVRELRESGILKEVEGYPIDGEKRR